MIFFNRTGAFNPVELAPAAQFAPAFAVNVVDFDGDGDEDIFLSQNFFGTQMELSRCDAGRGLWVQNDGSGKLTAISAQESGIEIYGEQRGAAVCDFDHDGRPDLAVTQNNGETKLYKNSKAAPGLRVILPGQNAGAQIRLQYAGGKLGPVRNIAAGSGYWSQDSLIQILGQSGAPESLRIRWPGGKEQTAAIKPNSREIRVEAVP